MQPTSSSSAPHVPTRQVIGRLDAVRMLAVPEAVSPTYDGPCRLLDWKQSAKDGMTVDLRLVLPGALGGHAFRGMSTGRETGQRFSAIISFPRQVDGINQPVIHAGETLLMRWSENDRTGMMVRLMLDDGPDGVQGRHPFFGLTIGRITGEPLDIVAWGINDDESAAPSSGLRQRTPFHQLTEVQQSQVLCRDARFRAFLKDNLERLVHSAEVRQSILEMADNPEQFAAAAVRAAIGATSRAIMNRDGSSAMAARAKWRTLIAAYEDEVWGVRR